MSTNRFQRTTHSKRLGPHEVGPGWWACAAGFAFAFVFAITWLLT
jgi:hypothetical protein